MSQIAKTTDGRGNTFAAAKRTFLGFPVTMDWVTRPLFAVVLASAAIAAIYYGGFYFAVFTALGTSAAAREWHRMYSKENYRFYFLVTAAALFLSLGSAVLIWQKIWNGPVWAPWVFLLGGALLSASRATPNTKAVLWHAAAVVYIGVPALLLVLIRVAIPNGFSLLLDILVAVWATDTGALFAGNLLKGPKLWPTISPNKTWAGFWGGIFAGAVSSAIVSLFFHANPWLGAVFGAFVSVIGHAGDLFESWMKRKVGRKNSGSLIPGHGGILDRIDSLLFVVPATSLCFFVLHFDPLLRVTP